LAQILSNAVKISGGFLKALEKDSMIFEEQRESFATLSNKMRIVCAFEEIPTSIGIVREVATISFR